MHFLFLPYGARQRVEWMLRDMEAQKFPMPMWKLDKKGVKQQKIAWINGQVRVLPGGIMDYVFTREHLDHVLNTLIIPGEQNRYKIPKLYWTMAKNVFKIKAVPKDYAKKERFLWTKTGVNVIPIGIKEDADIVGIHLEDKGWTHEAI